jgi:hypothetical protein
MLMLEVDSIDAKGLHKVLAVLHPENRKDAS